MLALGKRDTTPWAPGVRALAQVMLHNDAAVDTEFANLQASLIPLVGGYEAEKTALSLLTLAAGNATNWQGVQADFGQLVTRDDRRIATLAKPAKKSPEES